MNYILKNFLVIITALFVMVSADLYTKEIAKEKLKFQPAEKYFGESLVFVYAENNGGMLSFGSTLSDETRKVVFRYFVSVVLLGLFIYILIKKDLQGWEKWALILFLGGGTGNLINRFTYDGIVIDFMLIDFFGLRTGVFNLADMYVTAGVIIFILLSFLSRKKTKTTV